MVFSGLVGAPLMYVGGSLFAAIFVLYILRLRRRPLAVPFSPLWRQVLKEQNNTEWRNKLRRWLSLILQLVLAGLLILALSEPEDESNIKNARHVLVLLDTSASMQTLDVLPKAADSEEVLEKISRLAQAKSEAHQLIDGLALNDRMLIVRFGATPQPATPFTDRQQQLHDAVAAVQSRDVTSELKRAFAFANDALSGLSNPEVVLISDGAFPDQDLDAVSQLTGVKLSYVPVGQAKQNLAVTGLSVRRYPLDRSRYEVQLDVTNFAEEHARTELQLSADGNPIEVTSLTLAPGESVTRTYENLSGADQTLEARLKPDPGTDFLEADNHAYAVLPTRRRANVLVVSPGNTYLEAALLLDEYLDVTVIDPTAALPESPFDVTILDGVAPRLSDNHGSALYLNPPADTTPIPYRKRKPEIAGFGFDTWDKNSPLLHWMAVENIQVAKGYALSPQPGDNTIGASELGPILVAGKRDERQVVVLGFDPRDSDFVLRVAWPLFLLNTINAFTSDSVDYHSSLPTGTVSQLTLPEDARQLVLESPTGKTTPVASETTHAAVYPDETGFYRLRTENHEQLQLFAANLGRASESAIAPLTSLSRGAVTAELPSGFEPKDRFELWRYVVLAALLLSGIEWFSYHRRITV